VHRTLVALYLVGTTAVALLVRDLGVVVSLGGAVSAVIIIFFFPAAAYLSLLGPAGAEADPTRLKRAGAGLMIGLGVVLAPLSSYVTLVGVET